VNALNADLIAKTSITIDASIEKVWNAFVDPEVIKQYMFGTTVLSDWREGSAIVWKGEWGGKSYEDKGVILRLKAPRMLQYSHFSPLSGQSDSPENYHTVTVELSPDGAATRVDLTQDNNSSDEGRAQSEKNWQMMLAGLKQLLEQ
jgi:uncharacterized protein YndB with AHSA1/START domain